MVSERMRALGATRSCIRELFEYGLRQAAVVGKENVYDYSLGNPSIPAPPQVNEAFIAAVRDRNSLTVHGYTPASGSMEAKNAVADDLNKRFHAAIRPQDLFFTCGAAPALVSTVRALAVDGAEILAIAPHFPEYRPFVEQNGAKFVVVPADTDSFQIRLDELDKRLNSHTQAVLVNSPNNPSGAVYTRETLRGLAELLTRRSREFGHPVYIIADEPYRELVYDGVEVPFIPAIYPDTVICYSWSKSLSLPGERIGYVCIPGVAADHDNLMNAVAGAARTLGHVCAPSLQQIVAAQCAAVRPDLQAYDRNRRKLYEDLTAYGYHCVRPEGAFYLLIEAPGGDSQAFSDAAKEKNLLVVPGGDFGVPAYFRISTCVSYDMILRSLPIFRELAERYR